MDERLTFRAAVDMPGRHSVTPSRQSYDFVIVIVIVRAGTAGCVLASRLSEDVNGPWHRRTSHSDPLREHGAVFRAWERFARSGPGRAYARHIGRRIDPWFYRVVGRSYSNMVGSVAQAPLKTAGAKSGISRVVQLSYFRDGSDPILIASNYGGSKNPQWYYNLKAHPECEFGDREFFATEITDPDEHARLYALAVLAYAGWGDYRAKTGSIGRRIPVFRLASRQCR